MDLEFWESVNFWALGIFAAVWVFALGAVLGSFLNVIVYRLPRGMPMGLVVSRCPKCANPIAARDNIPILSWLVLRGRCRSCGQHISPRYPIVEATVGGLFVLLFYVELVSGGANLPGREPDQPGLMEFISSTPWDLVGYYFYHCALLYLLLAIALIELDRRLVPISFLIVAIVIGFLGAAFHPLPINDSLGNNVQPMLSVLLTTAFGFAIGGLPALCYVVVKPRSFRRGSPGPLAQAAALLLIGGFLGWQAALSVAVATLVVRWPMYGLGTGWPVVHRIPSSAYVGVLTLVHIFTWRSLRPMAVRLEPDNPTYLLLLGLLLLVILGLVANQQRKSNQA